MRLRSQRTVGRPVKVSGTGYWSGRECVVELLPAPANAGVVFVRGDVGVGVRIPATVEHRVDAVNRTTLASAGVQVQLVEHCLSALAGLGVDACVVRVSAEEMPGLDGSSLPFVEAIDAVGLEDLAAPVDPLVMAGTVRVEEGDAWIEATPPRCPGLSVEYELDYGPGPIGRQSLAVRVDPGTYRQELAAARTFLSAAEAARLAWADGDATGPRGVRRRRPDRQSAALAGRVRAAQGARCRRRSGPRRPAAACPRPLLPQRPSAQCGARRPARRPSREAGVSLSRAWIRPPEPTRIAE
jgi:UDP-3-O-acyl-N-acetylglucosamine deacetylase